MGTHCHGRWILTVVLSAISFVSSQDCEPPPLIGHSGNNATFDSTFPEGSEILYVCDFLTIGRGYPIYTCDHGVWTNGDDQEFVCRWKTCRIPDIEHGSYTADSITVGNIAHFQCDEGFKLRGPSRSLCRINRKWRNLPTCHRVTCEAPRRISNMKRFQNTHGREPNIYGSHITNTCEDGYSLIGPSLQKCENNGQWTGPPPFCEEINCGVPEIGSGYAYYDDTTLLSHVVLDCDDDAVLEGDEFSYCYEDGWTYSYCHGACAVPYIDHGIAASMRITHGQALYWRCDRGHVKSVIGKIECKSGNLTSKPACQEIEFNTDESCPDSPGYGYYVTRYQNKCYILIDTYKTYDSAKTLCDDYSWTLVSIDHEREMEFVSMALKKQWTENTWLGIKYSDSWKIDGRELGYTNWKDGEGGNSWFFRIKFQECAVMEYQYGSSWLWDDVKCDVRARVMCETNTNY